MRMRWTSLSAGLALWGLLTVPICLAADPPRALMVSPAKDCAVVADFAGFKDVKTDSHLRKITLNEGLVIRGSKVENGKVVIPASGLYYTTRTPKSGVLQGDKVLILGKLYHFVDQASQLDVIKDVWVKKDAGVPFGDGTKKLELSTMEMGANGFPVPNATFKILKQSGNYYGVTFPVAKSDLLIDITSGVLNQGTKRDPGTYHPSDPGQDFETEFYASSVAVSGQTYLVASQVTPEGAQVREFATGAARYIVLTEKDPAAGYLAPGEKLSGGGFTVEATEVGPDYAQVKLTCDQSGQSWTKRLGPITAESIKYMPVDEQTRERFVLRDAQSRALVQINLYQADGPINQGKVSLSLYHDLFSLGNPCPWEPDRRFVFRPDT